MHRSQCCCERLAKVDMGSWVAGVLHAMSLATASSGRLGVDRAVDRHPANSQCRVCIHGSRRKESLQARHVLRTSVLLIICRSRVRAPPAPPGGLHVSAGWRFTFGPCRAAMTTAGQDQGRCIPAFPRKRPAQLRTGPPACGLAALNLWSELKQDRIRAGQSQT
jgi:hypothetical protein